MTLAIFFGVYPQALLNYMQPSVNKTVVELTEWKKMQDKHTPPQQTTDEIAEHPCYVGYFRCWNEQRYYEAHDVLEHLWLRTKST